MRSSQNGATTELGAAAAGNGTAGSYPMPPGWARYVAPLVSTQRVLVVVPNAVTGNGVATEVPASSPLSASTVSPGTKAVVFSAQLTLPGPPVAVATLT